MQANVLRRVDTGSVAPASPNAWLLPFLVVTAMLQSLLTGACLWGLALFVAAAQSGTLKDVLDVTTALVEALLRLGLHVLFV